MVCLILVCLPVRETAMVMKTPGVYIVEKNAFPNSVVEVDTAVPAFIGYTEKAVNAGQSLTNVCWPISSMNEYIAHFGDAPQAHFMVEVVSDPNAAPTCSPKGTDARSQVTDFSWNDKVYRLKRAAGKAGGRFLMHQAMRHFFANGGGRCQIVSVGSHDDEIEAGGVAEHGKAAGLIGGLQPLLMAQEPTMVLTPDAVLLNEPDCIKVQRAVLEHCGRQMRNRFAILDIWGGELDRKDALYDCIDGFRADIGTGQLGYAAAYYPWLHTTLVQPGDFDYSVLGEPADRAVLVLLLRDDLGITAEKAAVDPLVKQRADVIDDLNKTDAQWAAQLKATIDQGDQGDQSEEDKTRSKALVDAQLLNPNLARAMLAPTKQQLNKRLADISGLYRRIMTEACAQLNLMPPSAAMAGLYTMVDNNRGVWKAPANISLNGVARPAVEISHDDQEDLNVTTQGKSINAIRSFVGEGTLVWGARTLDGNSLDWRYINVRRTVIMLEESCRLATQALVFEPNVANTWVTIKSMICNFLTSIWKRGGLAGAVPEDAFSIHVGLGETMTPEDILEGILRVTVLVAISRPAEYIEITFQQQMQKS
jgi:phage tail sheath protein FI